MELSPSEQQELNKICKEFSIKLMMLHGSHATKKNRKDSDIDIAFLCFEKDLEADKRLLFHTRVEALFKQNFEKNFTGELDLHSLHKTDPLFQYNIAKKARLLYGTKEDFNDFRLHAFVQYHDSYDLRELERKLIEKQQAGWREQHDR